MIAMRTRNAFALVLLFHLREAASDNHCPFVVLSREIVVLIRLADSDLFVLFAAPNSASFGTCTHWSPCYAVYPRPRLNNYLESKTKDVQCNKMTSSLYVRRHQLLNTISTETAADLSLKRFRFLL